MKMVTDSGLVPRRTATAAYEQRDAVFADCHLGKGRAYVSMAATQAVRKQAMLPPMRALTPSAARVGR